MRFDLSLFQAGSLVTALAMIGQPSIATDDPKELPKPIALFDGRSLDGWKPITGPRAGTVAVQGDAIALATGAPMSGVTSTRKDLPTSNYALSFEAKRTSGDDFFAAATFPVGPSFVTLINGGWGGSVTGLSLINGANASENETNHFVKYQNDVWYSFEVQVTAKVIRCLVNGSEVFAFEHEDIQLKTRIETRSNEPVGFASYRSSSLIRNVQIKPLTPGEIAEVDARIKQD